MKNDNPQVKDVTQRFEYYKSLGERAMQQVDDDALFWQPGEQSNSIAIIVGHLAGNMRSRWSDFLTSDGEKEWCERDAEFEPLIKSSEEMMMFWTAGWHSLFSALSALSDSQLTNTVLIRGQAHSVRDAIDRQLAHYAYHVGQIVFICKLMAQDQWQSLTIPKGKSREFNDRLFAEKTKEGNDGRHSRHPTD